MGTDWPGIGSNYGPQLFFQLPLSSAPSHRPNILQTSVAFIVKWNIFVAGTCADTWLKKMMEKFISFLVHFLAQLFLTSNSSKTNNNIKIQRFVSLNYVANLLEKKHRISPSIFNLFHIFLYVWFTDCVWHHYKYRYDCHTAISL